MKKSLAALGLSLMLLSSAAFAVPSLQQVEQSIAQRNWQQADAQLSQVIDAHPNNAHARYLYAQVLDREGRASDALAQLQRAKSLDPQLRFTDASRFAQTESRIRADAARVSGNVPSATQAGTLQPGLAPAVAPAEKHGPSTGMWIGLGLIVAVIALVLRWTLRRARTADNGRADDERRAQLKRATDVLNDIRPLKLDAKLSTAPGAAALTGELETIEADARTLVETLSNGKNPVPPYRVDELEQRHASVKARVEGRPDPAAQPAAPANGSGSVYAQEADRMTGAQGQPYQQPYPPQQPYPQQQPPVVIQQGGGGFGGGMGGLLTGVLLGEAMSGGRERVVERDVIVDGERRRQEADPGFDLGRGDDSNWSDGSGSGGGMDLGSNDDGWTDDNT
ncbi:tetratricopeptide repeat protein [Burkholderia seminalis]|uniref:tetratricopeptide repeat protein n=1 Tax=Burkholderia seminalis TaxID=488731 RepID=UPI0014532D1D|nr:tetratricopeptide repeat protein [Burkholderia seminalis]MBJ9589941.1 tetratricopeptide repeat protein [Burkholderia seminalis]MCA8429606.1 tetratricopeptide repeat protein [Burkholderia seminalis]VWB29720.1 TPR repeat-containing protein [Burkholderia seminalis]